VTAAPVTALTGVYHADGTLVAEPRCRVGARLGACGGDPAALVPAVERRPAERGAPGPSAP
jgi:hypothetical protein